MLDVAHLFPEAAQVTYLNTASMALGNTRGADALRTAVDQWSQGTFDWVAAEGAGEELRGAVAHLLRVAPEDLAFVTGASGGASTVAAQLPEAAPGANVVIPARDFMSNLLPWVLLRERGYEIRLAEGHEGALPPEAFAALVDRKTAVIATSLVQSASGFMVDLDALKTIARGAGAWLVIDASQALGSVDVDVTDVDAVFSCSHKWLLGIRGMGHLYVHPNLRDSFRPISPGWKASAHPLQSFYGPEAELSSTASKLDVSTPWFDLLVNLEGMRIINDVGIGAIEAHNRSLIDDLESRGFSLRFDRASRSPIVSLALDDTDATLAALERENIRASVRAGRLRISVHLYNTLEQMELLASAIT